MPILEEMLNSILERMQEVATSADANGSDIVAAGNSVDMSINGTGSSLIDSLSVLNMDDVISPVADKMDSIDSKLDMLMDNPFKEALADFIGITVLASSTVLGYISKCSGTSIAVLGMEGAGKTMFYSFLQNKKYNSNADSNTQEKEYNEFIYITKKGNRIRIKAGLDIGGQSGLAQKHYSNLIKQSDTIFFLFDLHNYLNDKEYLEDTNARLDFIYRHISDKSLYIFCTHMNKIEKTKRKDCLLEFKNRINGKQYSSIINSIAFVELTDPESLKDIENKLFD